MKQINDIPVRRRPQSKDFHAGEAGHGAATPDPALQVERRRIWEQDGEAGAPAGFQRAPEPPQAPSGPPKSTPLILRNEDGHVAPPPPQPVAHPETRQVTETRAPASSADPMTRPLTEQRAAPADPALDDGPVTRPLSQAHPVSPQPQPQPEGVPRRAMSRPRAAEPATDPVAPAETAPMPAAPASMRQRSRPMMPSRALSQPAADPATAEPAPERPTSRNPGPVSRAKTRLIGFHAQDTAADPLAADPAGASSHAGTFPTGWMVIVDGPGKGAAFSIGNGVATIGRGEDQCICLDFGDMSVSRQAHASVAYDEETNKFFIGHGGKSNVVRRNGAPVLATEELHDGDFIRIGKTTLRFAAFCTDQFNWAALEKATSEGGHG